MTRMLGRRAAVVIVAAVLVAASSARAGAGPCPPEVRGGCKGFLRGKHLALAAMLGTGIDASPIGAVAVTPDGKTGYGLRQDGALDAWDLATGALGRVAIARFIALDPRGRWAVASRARKDVPDRDWFERGSGLELWDLAARRRVAAAKVEWEHPLTFAFSPRVLVWGYLGESSMSWVWDAATGKVRTPDRELCAGAVAVTPDGKQAVCGDGDEDDRGGVVVWDLDRLKVVRQMPKRAGADGGGQVAGIALSPDGKRALVILGGRRERRSVVWTLATDRVDDGPDPGALPAGELRWSPTGKALITIGGEGDRGVVLSPGDKHQPIELGDSEDGARDAVFLPDGKRILTGDDRGIMRLLSATDGRELRASRAPTGHKGEVLHLSVTRDGSRLLSYGKDGNLKLWDLHSNGQLRTIALEAHAERGAGLMTPDGAYAVASNRGLSVIKLPEGTPQKPLVSERNVSLRAVSPDGTLAFIGSKLWEIPSGREVWARGEWGEGAAAFSADQRHLYAATKAKGLVKVIDTASGAEQATLGKKGPYAQSAPLALAVSPREDFLIVAPDGSDPEVTVQGEHSVVARLDLPSGKTAWKIPVRSYVHDIAISPDGRWFVVTGSIHFAGDRNDLLKRYPARVELRATADGAVADALELESAGLTPYAAAFTPDGRALMIGTEEGPILRFAVTP